MKFRFTVLCAFTVMSAVTQTTQIDSLDRLIRLEMSDTARINLANKKVSLLSNISRDSSINLGKKNIVASKKIDYEGGEADARLNISTDYCYKGEFSAAKENIEAAKSIIETLNDSARLNRLYSEYGVMHGMQSRYDSAIIYFQKAIDLALRRGDKEILARSYQRISVPYQMISNHAQALSYLQKAAKIADADGDLNRMAFITVNSGIIYTQMGDTTRAEQTLLNAISLGKKSNLKNVELYAYSNLASLYAKENKFGKSYEFALKAAQLGSQTGDQGIQSTSLSQAAIALARQGKFEEAEALGKNAIAVADSSNQPLNIYQVYSNMGSILRLQEEYKEAIPHYEKSFLMMKDRDIYDDQFGKSYIELSECYEKTGNYSKALSAYKMSASISDSARSKQNIRKTTELTLNYEFEKARQVAKAEQDKENAVVKAKQLALLIGLISALILAVGAYIGFRNKQKANALLENQKAEIQTTLTELKTTQAQLIQSEKMASLGELTAGIAHEIQNPLNFVNNFSEVNIELAAEFKEELKKINIESGKSANLEALASSIVENQEKISHHGRRADSIVKGMLYHSRAGTDQKELTDINALADEYLRLSYHGLRAKDKSFNVAFETNYDERIGKINIVPQNVGRVLLNIISNAFHSVMEKKKILSGGFEPKVTLNTKLVPGSAGRETKGVEIRIKDNGMGISEKLQEKIYQPFFTTKPSGKGTGLGLSLSYDIVTKEHNGTINLETKEGEFAEFIIFFPV